MKKKNYQRNEQRTSINGTFVFYLPAGFFFRNTK